MTTITLPPALATRLFQAARKLGKTPDQAALAAITQWVEDAETAARHQRALGGDGETLFRPPDGFYD